MSKTMTSKNGLEVTLRIQKRMLKEIRKKLSEVEKTAEMTEIQLNMLIDENKLENHKLQMSLAQTQDDVVKKVEIIQMLNQRLSNLNVEFNTKMFSQSISKAETMPDLPPPRVHTTLEDVYKLTGEI